MKSARKILSSLVLLYLLVIILLSPQDRTIATQDSLASRESSSRGHTALSEEVAIPSPSEGEFFVSEPVEPTISAAVKDLPQYKPEFFLEREINPRLNLNSNVDPNLRLEGGLDPLLAVQANSPQATALPFLTPHLNFNGQGFSGVNPPDTVGDVGPNHYIQIINSGGAVMVIYDKSGSIVTGPTALDALGSGSCGSGIGDGIVLYDRLATRWMISEFASGGNHLCVYISQSPDPTGSWFNYDFTTPNFPDYPKYAVWSDAYYVSSNENSPAVYALDRSQMLTGGAATMQRFTAPSLSGFGFQALTPSDLDGATAPPAGSPNYFMRHRDDEAHGGSTGNDYLEIWQFDVDFAIPANSTFAKVSDIAVTEFDSDLCGLTSFNCIAQQGTSTTLDPLREVVMWRLQYRHFGSHETLVGNLSTDVDGTDHAGIRWFELRKSGAAAWSLFQEGTYAPDAHSRWMGSSAMDGSGNIAVGYNVSSSSLYPGLRYAGRLASDPAGTLPQSEGTLIAGSASNASNRHGDYSALSVDPADDCTFWFTGQYNVSSQWSTRIGTFKFDQCGSPDFNVSATASTVDVCLDDSATTTIDVGSIGGFSDPVTLSASGLPANVTAGFSSNPVNPPASSTLTFTANASASPGSSNIDVTGTASSSHSTSVQLNVLAGVPSAPTLTSPADGATNVSTTPTFSWNAAAGASSYDIEIATDAAFSNIVESASALADTSYTASTTLNLDTVYYWRVRANNACGAGSYSAAFSFTTGSISCTTYASTDIPKLIPLSGTSGSTTSVLNVANSGTIVDINLLNLNGSHTYMGDLDFFLDSPATTQVQLMEQACDYDEDFDLNLDDEAATGPWPCPPTDGGTYQPTGSLSDFDAEESAGTWTLTIVDNYTEDTGQLDGWSLEICTVGVSGAASIEVNPTSLESTQAPDETMPQTLTISNIGEANLEWIIDEEEMPVVIPDGDPSRLGATAPVDAEFSAKYEADFLALLAGDIVMDGSFEGGTPNAFWNETSTNFDTPLCDEASCGDGGGTTGANTGDWWAWFGGTDAAEDGTVDQEVTILSGAATLSFYFWIGTVSGAGTDYMEVLIDGNQVWVATEADAGTYTTYTEVTVDISAYADGATHNLMFHSEQPTGVSNFNVDDISISTDGGGGGGDCSVPSDISWLTVSPDSGTTAPTMSDDVTVTFDSTGLVTGTYTGTLCIKSNDPVTPLLLVPLMMTVEDSVPTVISDVRTTNVRDLSFTVSWLTNVQSTGEVHYGTSPNNLDQTAVDERGAATSDDTHYVTVGGLQAETTYYFDVVSGSTTDDNGGAHYSLTTGPAIGLPASDTLYGQVFTEDGTTVAEGTIVYITLSDANGAGTSGLAAPLSSLVNSDGYWGTNLGNARLADLSSYYLYSASGDRIGLETYGAADGVGCERVDTANDTPAASITLNVSECTIIWLMSLQSGWNHISLPVDPITTPLRAADVCDDINAQGGNASEIDRWHNGDGHICGIPFNNFEMVLGSDYFIKSTTSSTWEIIGDEVIEAVPLELQFGWNSIGIPHTDAYTAESLCDEIISQAVTAVEIDRWDAGGWDGHICGLPFNDFDIERGTGYFIRTSSAGTVIPNAPATPLQQPAQTERPSPDDMPVGQSMSVQELRISNLTDSAVTFSWLTDSATTGYVLYGETAELDQVAVDVRDVATSNTMHDVALTALEPETTYYFKVVSGAEDEGTPQSFTTLPSLESIPESDTVYGQVFLADGQTVATGTLIYLTLQDADGDGSLALAALLSALVDQDGYWQANLANARVADGSGYFSYSPTDDVVTLVAVGSMATQTLSTGDMRPAEPLILLPRDDKTHHIHLPIIITR